MLFNYFKKSNILINLQHQLTICDNLSISYIDVLF